MSNVIAINKTYDVLNDLGDYGEAGFNVYTRAVKFTDDNAEVRFVPNKKVLVRDDNHEP